MSGATRALLVAYLRAKTINSSSWHIAHDDDEDRDGCERYPSKLSLADREEERLQQLEDQWHDEQDSDYDNDDDFMEEMSSSSDSSSSKL